MATNTFTLSGTSTFNVGSTRNTANLASTVNINNSGSGYIQETQNITGSAWTALLTSSLSDVKVAWFFNTDLLSNIVIATGSAGQNILMNLQPDADTVQLTWSGSLPLFAKSFPSQFGVNTGSVVLQYILASS